MDIEAPIFNPAKRRKFLRKRTDDAPEIQSTPDISPQQEPSANEDAADTPQHDDEEPDEIGVTDIIRLRKAQRLRKGGIEFSTNPRTHQSNRHGTSELAMASDSQDGRLSGIPDRFVGQSGQRVDVDKHMYVSLVSRGTKYSIHFSIAVINEVRMTYIEAELAKRRHGTQPPSTSEATGQNIGEIPGHLPPERMLPQRQPATLGKLHEIDLGPDSKLKNIARTEAATKILAGGETLSLVEEDDLNEGRHDKNNKAFRNRRRRNSEDIMRDRLVEEVLRESKLDVYEEPQQQQQPEGDMAADDRIADQFRKDFLDAIHSRRRGARTKTAKTAKPGVSRGPKLGGSRSARAAMREKQNEARK
ncbi:hypothetical protein FQN57_002716 [Myotisia sp. PD_48]|nr:hypothetical protein FQN57_002716 [Myotisia sp. PD_48]